MNNELLEARIDMLANELDAKIKLIDVSETITHEQKMRLNALEFASCMYINSDGNKGDNKAEGFIAFANEVYKYLKEGSA